MSPQADSVTRWVFNLAAPSGDEHTEWKRSHAARMLARWGLDASGQPVLAKSDVQIIREELAAWRAWAAKVAECVGQP